jgi:signal transduction histidine kinase
MVPPDVHVALYRIAQEALNNVVKHARASEVTIRLRCVPSSRPDGVTEPHGDGHIELEVSDNGIGFDPLEIRPDHLGLGIMRERAETIGARLEIHSKPGLGTRLAVLWDGNKQGARDEER